jgi:hypothetical protein
VKRAPEVRIAQPRPVPSAGMTRPSFIDEWDDLGDFADDLGDAQDGALIEEASAAARAEQRVDGRTKTVRRIAGLFRRARAASRRPR